MKAVNSGGGYRNSSRSSLESRLYHSNQYWECPSSHRFLPISAVLAPGFLKFTSQEPQYCLKMRSRIPHRTLTEFVEFIGFVGFVEFGVEQLSKEIVEWLNRACVRQHTSSGDKKNTIDTRRSLCHTMAELHNNHCCANKEVRS